MTNILSLPQIDGSATSFAITTNGAWLDSLFFAAPGTPPTAVEVVGAITSGSPNVTVGSTAGIVSGMPIAPSYGVPVGAIVGTIASSTQFAMVNSAGSAVNATQNDAAAALILMPAPLDLTGIAFKAELRDRAGSPNLFLTAQTADGSLLNGGTLGTLAFNIPTPAPTLANLAAGTYALDIIATADGYTVNLFQNGPAAVVVTPGVTR